MIKWKASRANERDSSVEFFMVGSDTISTTVRIEIEEETGEAAIWGLTGNN